MLHFYNDRWNVKDDNYETQLSINKTKTIDKIDAFGANNIHVYLLQASGYSLRLENSEQVL